VINPWYFVIHNLHLDFCRSRSSTRRAQSPIFVYVFLFWGAAAHLGRRSPPFRSFSITNKLTHASGRTPLDEWSVRRTGRYQYNTKHTQETNIHAPSGIRNRDPNKRGTVDLRLRLLGEWIGSLTHHTLELFFSLSSPHGHKVDTKRSMSLFLKNSFKCKWTMSLSLCTTNYHKANFIHSLFQCWRNTGPNYDSCVKARKKIKALVRH
jgi:hypothetical protein